MTSISSNHTGQYCYHCEEKIFGDSILAVPPGEPEELGTASFHPDCYTAAWKKFLDRIRRMISF